MFDIFGRLILRKLYSAGTEDIVSDNATENLSNDPSTTCHDLSASNEGQTIETNKDDRTNDTGEL